MPHAPTIPSSAAFIISLATLAAAAPGQVIRDHRAVGYATGNEYAYDITRARDGGFLTAGYTDPETLVFGDMYLVRYDAAGAHLWSRVIDSVSQDREIAYSVRQVRDGGYLVGGETDSISARLGAALLRFDPAGTLLWSRVYLGTPFEDSFAGVTAEELSDGSLAAIARLRLSTLGVPTLSGILIRTAASGAPMFTNRYRLAGGAPEHDVSFTDFALLSDGFMVAGWIKPAVVADREALLVRLRFDGAVVWARSFRLPGTDLSADSVVVAGGEAVFAGRQGGPNAIVGRVSIGGGALSWMRSVTGFHPGVTAADVDGAGDFVFAGTRISGVDGALVKFSPAGAFIRGEIYMNGDTLTESESVIALPCDAGYAVAGLTTMTPDVGFWDVHMARTDMDGRTGCREAQYIPAVAPLTVLATDRPMQVITDSATSTYAVRVTPPASSIVTWCSSTLCIGDINKDGLVDFADYLEFLNLYDAGSLCADLNGDGFVDFADYLEFLNHYDGGC
ncbi:MAG: hypothetical protein IT436_01330 [Phycisphaerales bacterium]|nr:hypothetical protein [Phycisphaerales bacterium]